MRDRGINFGPGHMSGITKVLQNKGDETFFEPFCNSMDQRISWDG